MFPDNPRHLLILDFFFSSFVRVAIDEQTNHIDEEFFYLSASASVVTTELPMASLLKLFLSLEPSLRFYLRSQRIAELHEALISSLLVCQPEDPLAWLISCLLEFNALPTSAKINLDWNYFIPEIYRPVNRPINIESSLSYIFAVCDDTLEPSERQIRLAVEHYQHHIRRKLFYAWLRYYLNRLGLKRWLEQREEAAKEYHRVRVLDLHFRQWAEWGSFLRSFSHFDFVFVSVQNRLARQKAAIAHIQHCSDTYQLRIVVYEWNQVAQQSRRTRDYFERLERGEENQQGQGFLGHGEARDELSMLSREAAVKILAHLDVADLARCAQVCRNWKMLTQSSMLWAKLDLHSTREVLDDRLAMRFIQRARPYLQHLNLRQCSRIGRLTFLGQSSISKTKNKKIRVF